MKNNIIELLNKNLANVQTLYVKLHNYHWNITGMNFNLIHELTESYYEYLAKQYDEIAERIIQIGGKPLASMKDYLNNSAVKEESKNEFESKFVLESILADFELLNKEYKEISKLSGEAGDTPTAALADDNIAWYEKQIWMIKASLG